ncbi:DUF2316 family protein [Secundilactobacillus kimchicus]|uniref:DUF2316 family protein n=1 Tax=Secundilactobacillus kimchicus TaxID=528209 RepID=UPI001C032EFB|nr:DUF2316 family protein [Secundilactobacillus kimchicus]MBT9671950.1 DUF2316 family protein [Secundilactobacillus kimchicus]
MSLTIAQIEATKQEFKENIARSGLSLDDLALVLNTTSEVIAQSIAMHPRRIEDNWIIRNFLMKYMADNGIEVVPFTALLGDYHDYWFLDDRVVERGLIG